MAMYGPNGTVVKGSDTQPKDVVDYVVRVCVNRDSNQIGYSLTSH